jgi:hypothetical protein
MALTIGGCCSDVITLLFAEGYMDEMDVAPSGLYGYGIGRSSRPQADLPSRFEQSHVDCNFVENTYVRWPSSERGARPQWTLTIGPVLLQPCTLL